MPYVTSKTLRGSSRLVSFSQVVSPFRFLPLNRGVTSLGLIALLLSCATTDTAGKATVAAIIRQRRIMPFSRGSSFKLPHLDKTGDVGDGKEPLVGR